MTETETPEIITEQSQDLVQLPYKFQLPRQRTPWTKDDKAIFSKGGSRSTQAKKDAARLTALKRVIKQVGAVTEPQKLFLLNFLESGDTARSQVVKMANDMLNDPKFEFDGPTRSRLIDITLKAAEHQHGRAPIKVQSMNINLQMNIQPTDMVDFLEALQ